MIPFDCVGKTLTPEKIKCQAVRPAFFLFFHSAERAGRNFSLRSFFLLTAPGFSRKHLRTHGQLAQLVEHRLHTAGVTGSSPVLPTMPTQRGQPPSIFGAVVQSVRTPACHAGGRGFKSLPLRHLGSSKDGPFCFNFSSPLVLPSRQPFCHAPALRARSSLFPKAQAQPARKN